MTSWKDKLVWADATDKLKKKASFRGALFYIASHETSVGRRNVTHQYPLQDKAYVEDLGLDVDEFSITGYIVQSESNGYDYFTERDTLIKALKKEGSGILIHPFLGEKKVSLVGKAGISESFAEGGIARFSMTFVLADESKAPYPTSQIDHVEAVDSEVTNSLANGVDAFYEHYSTTDLTTRAREAITEATAALNKMMISSMYSIQGLGPAVLSTALTELAKEYTALDITDVCGLGNGLVGMFNGLESLSGIYGDVSTNHLYGGCSSVSRGISAGPMSGAKVNFGGDSGFTESSLSNPVSIGEEMGKTAVTAALEIASFGEQLGGDDVSEFGGALDRKSVTTVSTARESANIEAIIILYIVGSQNQWSIFCPIMSLKLLFFSENKLTSLIRISRGMSSFIRL